MRILASVGLASLLLSAAASARSSETVEQVLAGRVAGEARQCIPINQVDSTQLFDSGAILYRMRGGPDYLNTPDPKCTAIKRDRQTITSVPSTSLCRGDLLRIVDFASQTPYGACALNDFVPYPRIKKPKRAQ